MEIRIANKIQIKEVPDNLKDYLINDLRLENPAYKTAVDYGNSVRGIPPHIYNFSVLPDNSLLIPRGYRSNLLELVKDLDIECKIIDERSLFGPNLEMDSSKIMYRPYQNIAIRELLKHGEDGILKSPAGSGKTIMGLSLIPVFGQPTLWLTHTDALLKQTMQRALKFLPDLTKKDIGIIKGKKWKIGETLTIGMIQTLNRNPDKLAKISNDFGMVILDEAHHCPATTFTNVVSGFNPYYLYGLTATPYRRDKLEKMMFQIIGPITSVVDINEIAKTGGIILPQVKYVQVRSKACDDNDIHKLIEEFIVENNSRTKLIAEHVVNEAKAGNFCMVMSDRTNHCEKLYKAIKSKWNKVGIATGEYSKKVIDKQVEQFNNKELTVLVATFALLGEGFDVDFINRAFITCPFRNRSKAEQLIGRIQRAAEGKTNAIVYDYVDVDVGVLLNQFYNRNSKKDCRYNTYKSLNVEVTPY